MHSLPYTTPAQISARIAVSFSARCNCNGVLMREATVRYDTRRYFNVLSKADISQLYRTQPKTKNGNKVKKRIDGLCSEVSVNSPRGIRGVIPPETS